MALKRFASDRVELYTAERFLEPAECEELIDIIKQHLRPSTISHDGTADNSFRTSRTCDLVGGEKAVRMLDERICGAMGIDPAMAEPSQGQYYELGQEFKPHTDYFEPYELERNATRTLGQRTWTFMIYLNDVESGGHTAFVNTMALKLAQINDQTPDPAGGRFEHDATGHLTGFVGDAGMQVFFKLIPNENTREDYRKGAALISKLFTSKGVTSACDADASPEYVQGYQDARDAGELTVRVYCHVSAGQQRQRST